MKTDDPVIQRRIQEIQAALDGLRMACGIQDPRDPETELNRPFAYQCQLCSRMTRTQDDINTHMAIDHSAAHVIPLTPVPSA